MPNTETAAFQFEELLARCMGNIEFAERVLGKFQVRFQDDLTALQQALAVQNAQGVASVAHRVKGSAANVGAPCLCSKATQIEDLARADCISEIPPHLDQLRHEWDRFVRSVSSHDLPTAASASRST